MFCPSHSPLCRPNAPNIQIMKLRTQTYIFLHPPVTSSLLVPNILLSTLFSNTLNLCPSLRTTDQVSHPYKTLHSTFVHEISGSHSTEDIDGDLLRSALKMEAVCSSETSVSTYKSTRRYNPQDQY
jgi:hypothetical protein